MKPVAACGGMAVAFFVMHFPVAEEVGEQDCRSRIPTTQCGIVETWETAQDRKGGVAVLKKESMVPAEA